MAAAAGLDGGLLIGADHVVAGAQRPAVPGPGVQIQHPGGFRRELGVTDGDPGPVLPGFEGITGQPPADGGRRDRDLAAGSSRSRQGPRTDRARAASTACSWPDKTIWYGLDMGMRSLCRTRASARHDTALAQAARRR
jgi:hypothetical protein